MACIIVEDDPAVADALCALLLTAEPEVRIYGDAESFIAAGVPGAGDTVVVDIGLPGMSGEDLVDWLRRHASPVPRIIAISGRSRREIEQLRSRPGFTHFLRKPPSQDWLPLITGAAG